MIARYQVLRRHIEIEQEQIRRAATKAQLPKTVAALDQDLSKFKEFLDNARHADEKIL